MLVDEEDEGTPSQELKDGEVGDDRRALVDPVVARVATVGKRHPKSLDRDVGARLEVDLQARELGRLSQRLWEILAAGYLGDLRGKRTPGKFDLE